MHNQTTLNMSISHIIERLIYLVFDNDLSFPVKAEIYATIGELKKLIGSDY